MTELAPRVSVIMPCHNAAPYVAQALQSLKGQSSPPWEVIVIDDGSTDGSGTIAAAMGPPVHCHRQGHQGIVAARNHGLELVRGDLIAFLDADDLWPAQSLALRLARLAADPGLDGCLGLVECFASPDLSPQARAGVQVPAGTSPGRLFGATLLRREVFARVGGCDTSLATGEGLDWFARAAALGVALGQVDAVVLRRRIHAANTVRTNQRLHGDYLRVLRATLERRRAGAADHDAGS